jgi:hypothetical protein
VIEPSLFKLSRAVGLEKANPIRLRRKIIGWDSEPLYRVPPGGLENCNTSALCFEFFLGTLVDRNLTPEVTKE